MFNVMNEVPSIGTSQVWNSVCILLLETPLHRYRPYCRLSRLRQPATPSDVHGLPTSDGRGDAPDRATIALGIRLKIILKAREFRDIIAFPAYELEWATAHGVYRPLHSSGNRLHG